MRGDGAQINHANDHGRDRANERVRVNGNDHVNDHDRANVLPCCKGSQIMRTINLMNEYQPQYQ